jgi:MFS family permease
VALNGIAGPFRSREFRLLWGGQFVSNIGTWAQITAVGYLAVRFAATPALAALYVGIIGLAAALPVLVLSPVAGVAADHLPRKRILYATNSIQAATALVLGILVSCHALAFWHLVALNALRAANQAFDAPARQSWIPALVPPASLGNAIGLMSVAFNGPGVIGPPVAGLLIASVGAATSFYVNAAATLTAVLALALMRSSPPGRPAREPFFHSMRAGFVFLGRHPALRFVIVMMVVAALVVRPYVALLPAYAAHVVHVDARGFGLLLGASGIGGLCGGLATALFGHLRRETTWVASAVLMGVALAVLGCVRSSGAALIVLVVLGMAVLSFQTLSTVMLQMLSPMEMRGRVVGVNAMLGLGFTPAGSMVMGGMAAAIGLPTAFLAGGAFTVAIVLALRRPMARGLLAAVASSPLPRGEVS